jgi:phosphoglycerate kinase
MNITDLPIQSKRVLLRVDFNVPMDKGKITDDSRILAAIPTLRFLLSKNARIILMSHLGRPCGKEAKLSLAPIAKRLSEILQKEVLFAPDCIGPEVEKMVQSLNSGELLLLENLRFHQEEEEPNEKFVTELASLGDIYINDAFGTAHRAHASTALIAKHFPGKKAAGFLMEKEIEALTPLIKNPERPFHAIIGGAKISTKAGVMQNLRVDAMYIGGAMALPFFAAQGIAMGDFQSVQKEIQIAKDLLNSQKKIYLPVDLVIHKDDLVQTIHAEEGVPLGWQVADIGPKTVHEWTSLLSHAKTIFWNGPLGIVEQELFTKGTKILAQNLTQFDAKVIIDGGDSVGAIQRMGLGNQFFHLSTGGGASLEFLEYGHLPGIDALS